MAKLNDFSKIIVGGNEIDRVLYQGKTIWQKEAYLAQDSDFVKVNGHWVYRGVSEWVEIPTHINGQLATSTERMFCGNSPYNATSVTKVVLNHSNVTNMRFAFAYSIATILDLSELNTSNVTDMYSMFRGTSATTVNLSVFNTSKVTNMSHMFSTSATRTLDLSSFDTSKVTNMNNMFYYSATRTLDLSSFNTSNVTNMGQMFRMASARTGYARTQADADRFNTSSDKPTGLNFVVKP